MAKIIYDQVGQTCNRFWSYISSVVWAIQKESKVFIIYWDPDICHFENLLQSQYVCVPFRNRLWNFRVGSFFPMRSLVFHLFEKHPKLTHFYNSEMGRKLGFVQGWGSGSNLSCNIHLDYILYNKIKSLFRPNESICSNVESLFEQFRCLDYFIIGIHVRRGDYKSWKGGRFYYSDESYCRWMLQMLNLYSNRKVIFFVATNEFLNLQNYNDIPIFQIPNASGVFDLYGLSICDIIIGPPSTFSQWASFYGNVPLCVLYSNNQKISLDDFSVIDSQDHFENGHYLDFS